MNSYITVTVTLLIFLLTLTACKAETYCYICQTGGGLNADKCGDDFRLTSDQALYCEGTCQKTRGFRSEGSRKVVEVTRGCVSYTASESCGDGRHNGIDATVCTCNTYYCNSASTVIPSKMFSFLLGVLLTLLTCKIL